MHYQIKRKSKSNGQAAYLQLYTQLREDITRGRYAYGMKLPSKRTLAEDCGVSVITVEHACALLADEGYLKTKERSGYFVVYREDELFPVSSAAAEKPEPETGTFEKEPFPYSVFARTCRRVLGEYGESILTPSPNCGCRILRTELARYLGRSRNMQTSPEQIVIGSGAEYIYSLVVQMLGRNRLYALEDPSYEKIRKVYEANGARCAFLKLGRNGIPTQELASTDADVLHVTPFNSYPSGITANATARHAYVRWAKERHATIVEDDYDSEFSELTKAEDTLYSLDPGRSVIYVNTFSRTISSAMRMGYMVLPAERAEEMLERISFYSCTVPVFEQYVLAELLRNGDFERHINRVRRKKRQKTQ